MAPMKKLLLLLLLSFCCLAFRCASSAKLESGNINQDDIHQAYFVKRSHESMEIRARFRLNDRLGDTLALSSPSRVSYNDKEMARQDHFMTGANYFADEKSYQAANRFVFTDTKGKTYANAISLEPIEFASDSVLLKKSSQSLIPVTRIIKDDDVKTLLTIKESTGKEFTSEVHSGRGIAGFRSSVYFDEAKKAIIIEPGFLKEIAEGAVTISFLARKEKDKLEQATKRGGEISIEYAADPINAKVSSK
jgi:hypothetical protein